MALPLAGVSSGDILFTVEDASAFDQHPALSAGKLEVCLPLLIQRILFWCHTSFEAGLHGARREQGYIWPTLPGITSCSMHTISCLFKFISSTKQSILVSLMMSVQGER